MASPVSAAISSTSATTISSATTTATGGHGFGRHGQGEGGQASNDNGTPGRLGFQHRGVLLLRRHRILPRAMNII
jgi:hypothetical protein